MRNIDCLTIKEEIKKLFIKAAVFLPDDVTELIKEAEKAESGKTAKSILGKIIENSAYAQKAALPICQDTGMAFVFAEVGQEVHVTGGCFEDAINGGVSAAYTEGYLRKSVVTPLDRINTGDNTPAVIYTKIIPGDKIKLFVLPKGFGSENMSRLAMLDPSAGKGDIINFVTSAVKEAGGRPCPPLIIGVGIGGSFDYAPFLAKKALTRTGANPDAALADLEGEILKSVNETKVGAMGLGGDITALKVAVEAYPTHIASLPVAVNISCHATRHAYAEI
ncbi:MAG: fumarate hydratase [Eubacteriales bacterium]